MKGHNPVENPMRRHFQISRSVFFAVIFITAAIDQSQAASVPSDIVDDIRQEIQVLSDRIKQQEASRQGVVEQLQNIDRQIELRRRLIKELERREDDRRQQANQIGIKIQDLQKQEVSLSKQLNTEQSVLEEMKKQIGARLAFMYMRQSSKLTLLFTSADLNELSQRQHYIQAVEKHDRNQLIQLREQLDQVQSSQSRVKNTQRQLSKKQALKLAEVEQVRLLLNSRKKEENNLNSERMKKSGLLEQITKDAELVQILFEERRQSLQEIEREIDRLVKGRGSDLPKWDPDFPFHSYQGKLPWPLDQHKITRKFGRNQHPTLGTTTENPGIDLAAKPGDRVYAVAPGQVTRIAWLRGFGNTILLSHGDGFYTVYARLGEILVSEGDLVDLEQEVGSVGDSGIEKDFHFEIWKRREKLNPVKWLKRL